MTMLLGTLPSSTWWFMALRIGAVEMRHLPQCARCRWPIRWLTAILPKPARAQNQWPACCVLLCSALVRLLLAGRFLSLPEVTDCPGSVYHGRSCVPGHAPGWHSGARPLHRSRQHSWVIACCIHISDRTTCSMTPHALQEQQLTEVHLGGDAQLKQLAAVSGPHTAQLQSVARLRRLALRARLTSSLDAVQQLAAVLPHVSQLTQLELSCQRVLSSARIADLVARLRQLPMIRHLEVRRLTQSNRSILACCVHARILLTLKLGRSRQRQGWGFLPHMGE